MAGKLDKPKRPRGRPSKFDPVMAERFVAALMRVGFVDDALDYATHSRSTHFAWLREGAEMKPSGQKRKVETVDEKTGQVRFIDVPVIANKRDYLDAVRRAESAWKMRKLDRIEKAGEAGDWKADQYLLSVKDPARYNPRITQVLQEHYERLFSRLGRQFADRPGVLEEILEAISGSDAGTDGSEPPAFNPTSAAGGYAGGGQALLPSSAEPEAEEVP